ncbi:hypothetical protein HNP37_004822 [Flavobacterium nitrogenifigens]|uniref:Uncharacterized protein n=2 Tax=Flavobacterium TaxID=237 RepID=A0A7W7NAP3_9FLAO|nr:hypothetical protein [Flavobacterium nitrogenifigens]MBB6389683.1 hypothetical protein [Flavobacterium notoginsengisoli]
MLSLLAFSNPAILLLLLFVFRFASERLSIQYVYERVLILLRLCLKAGAKLKNFFVSRKKNLKFFEAFFSPHFPNFSSNTSKSFPCFAGCKCRTLFQNLQAFFELFFFENFFPFHSSCLPVFL